MTSPVPAGAGGEIVYHGVADLIAARFHETYERLAPGLGYETRPDSAVSWSEVPEANRLLMRRTVQELLDRRVIGVPFPAAGAGGVDREAAKAAAARAIFDELGPECIEDDVAKALATAALDAVMPFVAAALAAAEQRADTAEAVLSAVHDALMRGGQTEAIRAQQARFALSSRPVPDMDGNHISIPGPVQPESEQR